MKAYGIIPARYKSTRFEGKPLALIQDKPMFWHVYTNAKKANLEEVFLATDDIRIQEEAEKYNIPCVMTRTDHVSGSDRVYEAAQLLNLSDDAIIVNIQGDEPLLKAEMLNQLIKPFEKNLEKNLNDNSHVQITTLAHKLSKKENEELFLSPNTVKIVLAKNNNALYFSRAPLPFLRDDEKNADNDLFYAHIGLYAFLHSTLKNFTSLLPTSLECIEKLEQLRLLENSIPIHVVTTEYSSFGVDTQEDLEKVRNIINT